MPFEFVLIICFAVLFACCYLLTLAIKVKQIYIRLLISTILPLIFSYPAAFALVMTIAGNAHDIEPKSFNQTEWIRDKSERISYAQGLDRSGLLIGRSTQEIINTLGLPDTKTDSSLTYDLAKNTWREGYAPAVFTINIADSIATSNHFAWTGH